MPTSGSSQRPAVALHETLQTVPSMAYDMSVVVDACKGLSGHNFWKVLTGISETVAPVSDSFPIKGKLDRLPIP